MSKRGASIYEEDELDGEYEVSASKRAKTETVDNSMALIASIKSHHSSLILRENNQSQRVSSLKAPEMILSGHDGAIYSMAFDPQGKQLCSGSMDKLICK